MLKEGCLLICVDKLNNIGTFDEIMKEILVKRTIIDSIELML